MNRKKLEQLIFKTTIRLFNYSEFACDKRCSLSPKLQAALSLLKEIKKDDFDLVEFSEVEFEALIIPEEIKAVLAEYGNSDPFLGFCSNEHIRMSFQTFLEKKGLLKEAEAFAMSRLQKDLGNRLSSQGYNLQVIVLGEGNDNN